MGRNVGEIPFGCGPICRGAIPVIGLKIEKDNEHHDQCLDDDVEPVLLAASVGEVAEDYGALFNSVSNLL